MKRLVSDVAGSRKRISRQKVGDGPYGTGECHVNGAHHLISASVRDTLVPMTRAEITTPEVLADESVVELSLRPQRLSEFIGQNKVKDALRIYIDAALGRREPLDHVLFFGPPGLGKTTLAELMARELGVNIRTTSGPALEKPGDLVGTLTNLRRGDIGAEPHDRRHCVFHDPHGSRA